MRKGERREKMEKEKRESERDGERREKWREGGKEREGSSLTHNIVINISCSV